MVRSLKVQIQQLRRKESPNCWTRYWKATTNIFARDLEVSPFIIQASSHNMTELNQQCIQLMKLGCN